MNHRVNVRSLFAIGLSVIAVGFATPAAANLGRAGRRLERALEQELALTASQAAAHRGLVALERERTSLRYTASVLDHASSESMRKLAVYRSHRSEREHAARTRGRVLYKLARGGVARFVFEPHARGPTDETDLDAGARLSRSRLLRAVVRHDLAELAIHRRAEARATAELVAATRERDVLSAVAMIQALEEHVLVSTEQALDPLLARAWSRRRRASEAVGEKAERVHRELMRMVKANWRALRTLRAAEGKVRLVRPVAGAIVGRFGRYEDPLLRLPADRSGVELRAQKNEPVLAMAAGRVVLVTELPGFEQVIVVDHGDGQYTLTARLWRLAVAEGDEIEAGQAIARVAPKRIDDGLGDTVYVELRHGEKPIDPAPYL